LLEIQLENSEIAKTSGKGNFEVHNKVLLAILLGLVKVRIG
jgi:hypothetical protein